MNVPLSPNYLHDCPNTGQQHKYFIFKTFEMYELVDGVSGYVKKEYAILGCNCSSVIRQEVQKV